jgi:hypothetical protein
VENNEGGEWKNNEGGGRKNNEGGEWKMMKEVSGK